MRQPLYALLPALWAWILCACCVSPATPEDLVAVGFRTPEQTFKTFQTALRSELYGWEYKCLSPGFKERNGGITELSWRIFREELWWLKYAGQAEIVSLRTEPTKRKKTRGLTCPGPVRTGTGSGQPILRHRVAFELRRIGSETERIGVEAYFYTRTETPAGLDANHPVCFDVSRRGQESSWSTDVVNRLQELLARPEALAARDERGRE